MAFLPFKTKCPCGNDMQATVKQPTFFEPTIERFSCKVCGSRFMLKLTRKKGPERPCTIDLEVLELSDKAQKIVGSMIKTKAKVLVKRVVNAIRPKEADGSDGEA